MAILYYLADFTEETMPCPPDLASWAAWLAAPDGSPDDWQHGEVADGQRFACARMEQLDDVTATRQADGWTFSRLVEADASFFAERVSPEGWDSENSHDDLGVFLDIQIESDLVGVGDSIDIAVCRDLPEALVEFRYGPPSTCTVVQSASVGETA